MNDPLHFIILGLAVWRLASLLADEDGPFDVLERLRTWLGVRYVSDGTRMERLVPPIPDGLPWLHRALAQLKCTVARGSLCRWCNSVWFGTFLGILYLLWPLGALIISIPLALSTFAILTDNLVDNS